MAHSHPMKYLHSNLYYTVLLQFLTCTFFSATIVPFDRQRARKTVLNCPRPIFFSISKFANRQKRCSEGSGTATGGFIGYVSPAVCCTSLVAATAADAAS